MLSKINMELIGFGFLTLALDEVLEIWVERTPSLTGVLVPAAIGIACLAWSKRSRREDEEPGS